MNKQGLQPHEVRVVEERNELVGKITKLRIFMKGNFYNTLTEENRKNFEDQKRAMYDYAEILDKRINLFEGKIEDTVIPLTRGQELVGYKFNHSNLNEVDKAKQLSADLIDMVLDDHDFKAEEASGFVSWSRNVLKTAAVNAVLTAQMAVVKILTWTK